MVQMRNKRTLSIVAACGIALAIGGGAYAFTASNTVPATTAGAGAGAVSGYTVTNLHYALDATTPANIDSLTFTINPAVPSTGSGKVIISAALSTGGPTNYTCTTDSAWYHGHVRDDPPDSAHGNTVDRRDGRRSAVAAAR